jgi:hypothetical protein
LPVFSVQTEKEATELIALACETNLAGQYIARELAEVQTVDNLLAFGRRLEDLYEKYIRKERQDVVPA